MTPPASDALITRPVVHRIAGDVEAIYEPSTGMCMLVEPLDDGATGYDLMAPPINAALAALYP